MAKNVKTRLRALFVVRIHTERLGFCIVEFFLWVHWPDLFELKRPMTIVLHQIR